MSGAGRGYSRRRRYRRFRWGGYGPWQPGYMPPYAPPSYPYGWGWGPWPPPPPLDPEQELEMLEDYKESLEGMIEDLKEELEGVKARIEELKRILGKE